MAGYSKKQLEELWVKAGGAKALAATMAAIGLAESKGGAEPYGDYDLGAKGYTSFGIWMIHTPAHPQYNAQELVDNPLYNAKAAVEISGNSEAGLGAWTTYKTGAYKAYLGSSGGSSLLDQALNPFNLEPFEKAGHAAKGLEKDAEEAAGSLNTIAGVASGLSWTKLQEVVTTLLLVAAGLFLIVYGIMVAVRPREGALRLPALAA
jgi:Lysozyme like domain